jgi:hypothetical protein
MKLSTVFEIVFGFCSAVLLVFGCIAMINFIGEPKNIAWFYLAMMELFYSTVGATVFCFHNELAAILIVCYSDDYNDDFMYDGNIIDYEL